MCQVDLSRLKKCMQRAEQGGELVIAFLGGSITQGSLAENTENTYAYRVFRWWKDTFPKAEFHYVNAGIGGTDSLYGSARAVTDVLMYQPDFIVVDFSVNDRADHFYQETYEGLLRRLLSWDSKPAVLLLYNVFYDSGRSAQEFHHEIGEWYHVPYVSIKDTVYQRMAAGLYSIRTLTPDGLHPNDEGHRLVAEEITSLLEQVRRQPDSVGNPEYLEQIHGQHCTSDGMGNPGYNAAESGLPRCKPDGIGNPGYNAAESGLPHPVTANAYETARRLTIREVSPQLYGFRGDAEEKTGYLDHFKHGWIGKKAGDALRFEVNAACIAVQYRKTIHRPALMAQLILDGDREHPILLDGNFCEDWGDCLYLEPVLHHGRMTKHIVDISILPSDRREEEMTPFYLMALIIA